MKIPRFPKMRGRVRYLVGALAGGGVLVWLTSLSITIDRVVVRGARLMKPAEVEKLVKVKPGTPMGRTEVRRVEAELARHPAFNGVSVSRGLTGTLHIRVTERNPVAWLSTYRCAVAEDGTLLSHVRRREAGWICLEGFAVEKGKVKQTDAIREALLGCALGRQEDEPSGGTWRRLPENVWEWDRGGKRVYMTSPIDKNEFKRLKRFRRAYPEVWSRARLLDLRFAERVVVKR